MPISLPSIPFDSPLIEYVVELERLRGDVAAATTSNPMVAELHQLFDLVSSLVSARIEGNRTTIYDAVVGARTGKEPGSDEGATDSWREITNITDAMSFIDGLDPSAPITHHHSANCIGLQSRGSSEKRRSPRLISKLGSRDLPLRPPTAEPRVSHARDR